MKKIVLNLSIVAVLFLSGCSNPTGPIQSKADIIGVITKISSNTDELNILVEEDPTVTNPDKEKGKKMIFFISKKTKIYEQDGSKLTKIKSEYLKTGMKVKV